MKWNRTLAGDQEVLSDQEGRALGRVKLVGDGDRWVALGASALRADVVGWYSTVEDAKLALERNILGRIQEGIA